MLPRGQLQPSINSRKEITKHSHMQSEPSLVPMPSHYPASDNTVSPQRGCVRHNPQPTECPLTSPDCEQTSQRSESTYASYLSPVLDTASPAIQSFTAVQRASPASNLTDHMSPVVVGTPEGASSTGRASGEGRRQASIALCTEHPDVFVEAGDDADKSVEVGGGAEISVGTGDDAEMYVEAGRISSGYLVDTARHSAPQLVSRVEEAIDVPPAPTSSAQGGVTMYVSKAPLQVKPAAAVPTSTPKTPLSVTGSYKSNAPTHTPSAEERPCAGNQTAPRQNTENSAQPILIDLNSSKLLPRSWPADARHRVRLYKLPPILWTYCSASYGLDTHPTGARPHSPYARNIGTSTSSSPSSSLLVDRDLCRVVYVPLTCLRVDGNAALTMAAWISTALGAALDIVVRV